MYATNNEHGVSIRMHGREARVYESKQMTTLIQGELSRELLQERRDIFKGLKPLMDVLEKDWESVIGLTSDGYGYTEVLAYNHKSGITKEVVIQLTHGQVQVPEVTYHGTDKAEMLYLLDAYLERNKDNHTKELVDVYFAAMQSLMKVCDERCKIRHTANRLMHSIQVVPTVNSKNVMGVCLSLFPRTRARSSTVNSDG